MNKVLKRVVGAMVGITAVAFLGIFACGVVQKLTEDEDACEDDYDDGIEEMQ